MSQGAPAVGPTSRGPRPSAGEVTQEKILRCAERLFAKEGIDRVTLRQIARAAGQRNVAAVQYHFGSKDRLIRSIVDRNQREVDADRFERLRALPGTADLTSLLAVLVEPLARKLDTASGRDYLQIQALRRERDALLPATRDLAARIETARAPGKIDPLRDQFVVLLLFNALADRARAESSRRAPASTRPQFVRALIGALGRLYSG